MSNRAFDPKPHLLGFVLQHGEQHHDEPLQLLTILLPCQADERQGTLDCTLKTTKRIDLQTAKFSIKLRGLFGQP
jgi:hypothetical protein